MSHEDDIYDELGESPILRSLKGKEPFEPPEGYFDQLSASMQDKFDDELVLAEAPNLAKAGKENIWLVPRNYFEELPGKVIARLQGGGRVRSMFGRRLAWAAAAAVVLILAIWLGMRPGNKAEGMQLADLEEIPKEELYEALDAAGVDSYDLMAVISQDEELVSQFENELEESLIESLEEDEILEELELGDLEELMMDL